MEPSEPTGYRSHCDTRRDGPDESKPHDTNVWGEQLAHDESRQFAETAGDQSDDEPDRGALQHATHDYWMLDVED